jgi:hypothetical protein
VKGTFSEFAPSRDFEPSGGRSYVEAKGDFLYIVPILHAVQSISPC